MQLVPSFNEPEIRDGELVEVESQETIFTKEQIENEISICNTDIAALTARKAIWQARLDKWNELSA